MVTVCAQCITFYVNRSSLSYHHVDQWTGEMGPNEIAVSVRYGGIVPTNDSLKSLYIARTQTVPSI